MHEFLNDVIVGYQGEIEGEVLFEELAESDLNNREKWELLCELERVMQRELKRFLSIRGITVIPDPRSRILGSNQAQNQVGKSWTEQMKWLNETARPYADEYAALQQRAEALFDEEDRQRQGQGQDCSSSTDEGRAVMRWFAQHEVALCNFALKEIDGDSPAAAHEIQSLLHQVSHRTSLS